MPSNKAFQGKRRLANFMKRIPSGFEFSVTATGNSMHPTILEGERVGVLRCPIDLVRLGDIVAFTMPRTGSMVIHRVVKFRPQGDKRVLETCGNANNVRDPWRVDENNFLGKAVWVKRGKRRLKLASHQQPRLQVLADKLVDVFRTLLARLIVERG